MVKTTTVSPAKYYAEVDKEISAETKPAQNRTPGI